MWSLQKSPDPRRIADTIEPVQVLYYFDEPLIFVTATPGFPIISYKIDEYDDRSLYLSVQTNQSILEGLRSGTVSLRRALYAPWCWMIETAKNFDVIRSWGTTIDDLPEDFFPEPNVGLYPQHGVVFDDLPITQKNAPFLSVYFKGGVLGQSIPFGAFKTLIDEAYSSIRKIFLPAIESILGEDFSDDALGRALSIPVRPPKFASLSIEIDLPKLDLAPLEKSRDTFTLDAENIQANIQYASAAFLESALVMRDAANIGPVPEELAKLHLATLEAMVPIVPTDATSFDTVEIIGQTRSGGRAAVFIDATAGVRIREAHKIIQKSPIQLSGNIIAFSLRSNYFVLKTSKAREVTCYLNGKSLREALHIFEENMKVEVEGVYTERQRRDLLIVERLKLPDGRILERPVKRLPQSAQT